MVANPTGLVPENDCAGEDQILNDIPVISSERAPDISKPATV
jgi:hypothetical protein